jgi:hypothetical protein
LTIDASGAVSTFVPAGPPLPPAPPSPASAVAISPSTPAVVVVGDIVAFRVTLTTNPYWNVSMPVGSISIVLPGNQFATIPATGSAFDLLSVVPSVGSCTGSLYCSFGPLGPSATQYVDFSLRARLPGSYQVVARGAGAPVTVPVTFVPRQGDLQIRAAPDGLGVKVGLRSTGRFVVRNLGPHVVSDAVVTVGEPRPLHLNVSVDGAPCSPAPIKCMLPRLAPGDAVMVKIATSASRAGRARIRAGVSSAAAVDLDVSNNTGSIVVTATRRR